MCATLPDKAAAKAAAAAAEAATRVTLDPPAGREPGQEPTEPPDDAIKTNAATLAGLTDVPCRGIIPHLSLSGNIDQDRATLSDLFSTAVDLPELLG